LERVSLPEPDKSTPLYQLLAKRRSVRRYKKEPLTLHQLSRLLWATYGLVDRRRRVVPSAGATYPIEVYVFVKDVAGLAPGIYRYDEERHELVAIKAGDYSKELASASLDQRWVREAPVNIVIVAKYRKTTDWYGERGFRYIYMEAGHVGQNIYLAATEMGLGTVAVGAFYDEEIAKLIGLGEDYIVLYVFPVGVPA
jgi:SagB-type dehydrogenase family enzyme